MTRTALALAVTLMTTTLPGCPRPKQRPAPVRRQVLAWTIGGEPSLLSLRRNADAIAVVSPAYYKVEHAAAPRATTDLVDWDAGNPVDREAARAVARQRHRPLIPLVACLGACAELMSKTLSDVDRTTAHVEAILVGIEHDDLDGVFIDYEGLTCPSAAFNRFIDKLAAALNRRGKRLGVAITEPCGVSPDCRREGYPFDIAHLVRAADYVAVMEYDYAVDGSNAVAPRDWVARGLRHVRRAAGPHLEKVFVGIPFYGRLTAGLTRDTGVLWSEIQAGKIQGQSLRITKQAFDAAKLCQVARVSVGPDRRAGVLYYDDHESLAQRLALVQKSGFANIAIWRLGGEDPCNWQVIRAWLKGEPPDKVECPPRGAP